MRIALFCIPAHGHTNPMLPVAAALVRRGHRVRFYSFDAFRPRILAAGAEYVGCDRFLPPLSAREEAGLMRVSATEMTIQDLRTTLNMDAFLSGEYGSFRPDAVFSDSVCFWGKLSAMKHRVPLIVSTSTFAFNRESARYMKHSASETMDLLLGLPRISRELKRLRPLGYPKVRLLELVQNDDRTPTVVYATRRFQPCAESFSGRYAFVGPSLPEEIRPEGPGERPRVYVALGTVINDRPDFYRRCIEALPDVELVISCGERMDPEKLGPLPENVRVYPRVDQLRTLAGSDAFLTHCGMNSVSEGLYMGVPLLMYPQTGEQRAVARRVEELGAGLMLREDSAEGIRRGVQALLEDPKYAGAARECRRDFIGAPGPEGAAAFIEEIIRGSQG